jgi:multidrug efflux pump subunit AcrB
VGASVAMLASLAVAFIVTPWIGLRLLAGHVGGESATGAGGDATTRPLRDSRESPDPAVSAGPSLYTRLMQRLMGEARTRGLFYAGVLGLLVLSMGLIGVRLVQVKMLPFDNKSEFQVILDLPEGTTLESSAAAAAEIAAYLRSVPEVEHTQVYAGTAAPFNFNGLVRHYFLRRGANVADVQVNLLPKEDRDRQSHEIAVAVRPAVDSIARRYGARRCSRRWWRRSTPTATAPGWRRLGGSSRSSSRRPVSWTWTGRSRIPAPGSA